MSRLMALRLVLGCALLALTILSFARGARAQEETTTTTTEEPTTTTTTTTAAPTTTTTVPVVGHGDGTDEAMFLRLGGFVLGLVAIHVLVPGGR